MPANPSLAQLIAMIEHRTPRHPPITVVAIDGPAGSGKTTLAQRLSQALADSATVHMDDLYPGWSGLSAAVPRLLDWVLLPLAAGGRARYRRYDWVAGRYAEWTTVPASDLLIVEGVGSGALATAPYVDVLIWVQAPRELRMRRGLERDGEAVRDQWLAWQIQEDELHQRDRTRERADVTIDGTVALG